MIRKKLVAAAVAAALSFATQAYAQSHRFDVPAQPATTSIPELARQAGVQIVATGDSLQGINTPAVVGEMDVQEALRRLLQGTGMEISIDESGTILVAQRSAAQGVRTQTAVAPQGREAVLETVEVIGYAEQNQQAIAEKRQNQNIGEFLSSDDLGQQPDYNIADALRRVPYVQTEFDEDEGKFVAIRGLNASYTLGSFDGATMASSERGNRQLNVEAIPTTMVSGAEVLMSRTPDVDGNVIGGLYNLKSRSPFDRNGRFYAVANVFLGASDSTDVPGVNYGRSSDDGMSYRFDGALSFTFGEQKHWGILLAGHKSLRRRDQERIGPSGANAGTNIISTEPAPFPEGTTNAQFIYETYANSVERTGVTAKLEYYPGESFRSSLTYSSFLQEDNELRYGQQFRATQVNYVAFNDYPIEKPLTIGKWDFTWRPADAHVISGQASRSFASFYQPTHALQFRATLDNSATQAYTDGDGIPHLVGINPDFTDPRKYIFYEFSPSVDDSDEYVTEGKLDWSFNRDGQAGWGLQVGVKFRRTERDMDSEQTTYRIYTGEGGNKSLTLDNFLLDETVRSDYAQFDQLLIDYRRWAPFFEANKDKFAPVLANTLLNTIGEDYQIVEDVKAAYLLGEWRSESLDQRLIFGGRFEQTDTEVVGWSRVGVGDSPLDYTQVEEQASYRNFLPSVVYTWDVSRGVKLRAAYFEGVGRPNPNDLRSSETISSELTSINRGNPDLKAREGKSYDAALEWYLPDDKGLFAFGLFRKEIKNEIYSLRTSEVIDDVDVDIISPRNAAEATINGLGLSYTLNKLRFLPGFLSDLGFSFNYSYLDGKTEIIDEEGNSRPLDFLPRMADQTINTALFYERGGLHARISYAHVDDTPTTVGNTPAQDRWLKAQDQLNLQGRYRLNKNMELIGEVRSLLGDEKLSYREYVENGRTYELATNVSYYGRQYWLGAIYRF